MKKVIAMFALVALFGSCEKVEMSNPADVVQEQQPNRLPKVVCRFYHTTGWHWTGTPPGQLYVYSTYISSVGCTWVFDQPAYGIAELGVSDLIDTCYFNTNVEVLENNTVVYSTVTDTTGVFYVPETMLGTYDVHLRDNNNTFDTIIPIVFDTAVGLHTIILN